MTLRTKTTVMIAATLALLLSALFVVSDRAVLARIKTLERNDCAQNVERAPQAVNSTPSQISATAGNPVKNTPKKNTPKPLQQRTRLRNGWSRFSGIFASAGLATRNVPSERRVKHAENLTRERRIHVQPVAK